MGFKDMARDAGYQGDEVDAVAQELETQYQRELEEDYRRELEAIRQQEFDDYMRHKSEREYEEYMDELDALARDARTMGK